MLGSFSNSSSSCGRDDVASGPSSSPLMDLQTRPYHHHVNPYSQPSPVLHTRQLLLTCAELISQSNLSAAHHLLNVLSSTYFSPYGDSSDRLAYHFTRALALRLRHPAASSSSAAYDDPRELQSCYLSLNQITPFVRFTHLTANQAILDAVNAAGQHPNSHVIIHIVDFDIMHGVQWPPLMQALAAAADDRPPPTLRITGSGSDPETLARTGDRLSMFAHSLGLPFQFHALHSEAEGAISISAYPDEIVAVNLVNHLHRLISDSSSPDPLRSFLRQIKTLNPAIVTVAETEASHNHPSFLRRFAEAIDHYAAVFDSLEATMPPNSRDRLAVETVWFGREIADIVAAEGPGRRERHERFETWEAILRGSGFRNVPLSPFAISQAKLLLRLHYPSEGYKIQIKNNSVFLGWQNRPLFSVSSWR